jgi:uncharacterized protein YecT (DUF1311 family)
MKISPAMVAIAILVGVVPLQAESAPSCLANRPAAICADKELAQLDKTIAAAVSRLTAEADPLTALLLRRDQRWFTEITAADGLVDFPDEFDGKDDPGRQRLVRLMEMRSTFLNRLDPRAGRSTVSGEWGNLFGTARITPISDDAVRVIILQEIAYTQDDDPIKCSIDVEARRQNDGWLAATGEKENDRAPDRIRLRLQGRTLRVVLGDWEGSETFCRWPDRSITTGSFFPLKSGEPRPASDTSPLPLAPSFDCATARNSDEEEICADPDLAQLDAKLAYTYRKTLQRLETGLASHLREDQRFWAADGRDFYDLRLHPPREKKYGIVHQTSYTRQQLRLRLEYRLTMLSNIETARQGFEGSWINHDTELQISQASGKPAGTLSVWGSKYDQRDYKAHCKFENLVGTIERDKFRVDNNPPLLERDGATLVVAEQRDYCVRGLSSKGRLLPVSAAIENIVNPN